MSIGRMYESVATYVVVPIEATGRYACISQSSVTADVSDPVTDTLPGRPGTEKVPFRNPAVRVSTRTTDTVCPAMTADSVPATAVSTRPTRPKEKLPTWLALTPGKVSRDPRSS